MRSPFKVAILAGGPDFDRGRIVQELSLHDRTICADKGYKIARLLGWMPQAVIGDLDSLDQEDIADLEKKGIGYRRYSPDKDKSDLELAIDLARAWAADQVTILAATGGRLDHTCFNLISILCYCRKFHLKARLVANSTTERFLADPTNLFHGKAGWLCSLLPLDSSVNGITLTGFRYPLQDENLARPSTRGLSNIIVSDTAELRVKQGTLLVFLSKPSPHQAGAER